MARAAGKPVMIAEAAPQGFDLERSSRRSISPIWDGNAGTGFTPLSSDEIWQAWYEPLFRLMKDNRDVVRALAYINCDWDAQPMWGPPYPSGIGETADCKRTHGWRSAFPGPWRIGSPGSGSVQPAQASAATMRSHDSVGFAVQRVQVPARLGQRALWIGTPDSQVESSSRPSAVAAREYLRVSSLSFATLMP